MCIRDRIEDVARGDGHLEATEGSVDPGQPREGPGEDAQDAVSYTHLRAHETVLDLVCRLLLEKKKKYIPSTNE